MDAFEQLARDYEACTGQPLIANDQVLEVVTASYDPDTDTWPHLHDVDGRHIPPPGTEP